MDNIPIVDAHHHLWDLENAKTKYSWLMVKEGEAFFGDYGAIRKSYLLNDYLSDAKNQNLIKSVHVQAEHDDDSPVSETEWLQKLADDHNSKLPNAIVAFADFSKINVTDILDQHQQYNNTRGIRQILSFNKDEPKYSHAPEDFMKNTKWLENFKNMKNRNLSLSKKFSDISFNLKKGEILGFAGLVGAGRTEVAKSVFGAEKFDKGEIFYNGESIVNNSPNEAINKGFAYVPEDRKQMGIFGPVAVEDNVTSAVPKEISNKLGLINTRTVTSKTNDYIKKFNIILTSGRQLIEELSGGNQQKCIISKWLLSKPKVLILDEPTRGVDVGVKSEMYEIINQLAQEGTAIILISSELPEILSLSHRIIVMREGKITKILNNKDATQENIMSYAIN